MKKTLLLFAASLLILLPAFSLAASVAERTGAPLRVTLSETIGDARLVFDAPVQASYGCRIPLFEASARAVALRELRQVMDVLIGSENCGGKIGAQNVSVEAALSEYEEKGGLGDAWFFRTDAPEWSLSPNLHGWDYRRQRGYGAPDYSNWTANRWRWADKGLTCRKGETEALALAAELVQRLAPEMVLAAQAFTRPEILQDLRLDDPPAYADELAYAFVFARPILSVPQLYDQVYGMAASLERMEVVISGDGVESVRYVNAMSLGNEWVEDAELLGFDHVLERAKAELSHRYGDRRVEVERIAFGYASVPVERHERYGYATRLQLVPVWTFYGNAYGPDEAYAVDLGALCVVHAVSGMAVQFNRR